MQQQYMGEVVEELKRMEDQLYWVERERDKAVDEVRGLKKAAQHRDRAIESLKSELEKARVGEETSKMALDEMAFALKEVGTEARKSKEELGVAKAELEHSRGEEERLGEAVKMQAEELERLRNMAERLRIEAEETLFAWSDKERGLVECLRRAEEDNARLADDAVKLRDILRQALRESKAANEAAEAAAAENVKLRDSLRPQVQAGEITDKVENDNENKTLGTDDEANAASVINFENDDLGNTKKRALLRRFGDLLLSRKRPLPPQP